MILYQAGEIAGFERLYLELAPRLRGWLQRQRIDFGAEVDDLLQEVFLQIHRSRHTYSPERPVEPWAFAIARHVYLMDRRSRGRKQARERHDEIDEVKRGDPAASSAEHGLATRQEVGRALAATTGKRRASVVLHHLWGFSFREIGRLLGVRPGAAKRQASRGVQDLRRELGRDEEPRA